MSSATRCCFVVGMHRSGTSAIAGGLAAAGVEFGTSLMPAAADNPRGFFEDTRVVALNERLIAWNLQAWDTVAPVPHQGAFSCEPRFAEEAREIVRSLGSRGSTAVGLKDPRASLLIPFWLSVFQDVFQDGFQEGGVIPIVVVCLRHPAQVAKSLYDRNRFSRSKSIALWLKYNLMLLEGLSECGLLDAPHLLSFDDLCAHPDVRVRHAREILDGTGLGGQSFVDFFDTDLTSPQVSRESENDLEELAITIHQSLIDSGMPAPELLEEWGSRWRRFEPLLSLIDLQYQQYAQCSADEKRWLRELEGTVEAKDKELVRLDGYARELLSAIDAQRGDAAKLLAHQQDLETALRDAEKEKAAIRRELTLALRRAQTYHQSASELEEVLSNRAEELAQLDQAMQSRQQEVLSLQQEMVSLQQALQERQRELEALYSSTSWRVSYPVRALRRTIGRLLPGDVRR